MTTDFEKAQIWNAALDHVWQLADPAWTVVGKTMKGSTREILTEADILQAKKENPYD